MLPTFTSNEITNARGKRESLDPTRPYAFFIDQECNHAFEVIDVATLFLTNRECPFRCLMCDLWKSTLPYSVSPGQIPSQIRFAISQLPTPNGTALREVKLYNSGNFFDPKAIPSQDYKAIADLVRHFDRVIVENHPKLCGETCVRFRDLVSPARLEIAIGLETCNEHILHSLNKSMTLKDFSQAVGFLHRHEIDTRAFLLLKPPFMDEPEAIKWTLKSIAYAQDHGVGCCTVIPTRGGNGIMETLIQQGKFSPPLGSSLESVADFAIPADHGRVFVDLWDAPSFFDCIQCRSARIDRLIQMNLTQRATPSVKCDACQ